MWVLVEKGVKVALNVYNMDIKLFESKRIRSEWSETDQHVILVPSWGFREKFTEIARQENIQYYNLILGLFLFGGPGWVSSP